MIRRRPETASRGNGLQTAVLGSLYIHTGGPLGSWFRGSPHIALLPSSLPKNPACIRLAAPRWGKVDFQSGLSRHGNLVPCRGCRSWARLLELGVFNQPAWRDSSGEGGRCTTCLSGVI